MATTGGKDFYSDIGRRGGQAVKEKRGLEFFREMGRKGGGSTKERYGSDCFSATGKRGGTARKRKESPSKEALPRGAMLVVGLPR